jgi:hypothetical protein
MTLPHRLRAAQLRQRRDALLQRSHAQRARIGAAWSGVEPALRWADLACSWADRIRRRPGWLALPLLACTWLAPRRRTRVAALVPLLFRLLPAGSPIHLFRGLFR